MIPSESSFTNNRMFSSRRPIRLRRGYTPGQSPQGFSNFTSQRPSYSSMSRCLTRGGRCRPPSWSHRPYHPGGPTSQQMSFLHHMQQAAAHRPGYNRPGHHYPYSTTPLTSQQKTELERLGKMIPEVYTDEYKNWKKQSDAVLNKEGMIAYSRWLKENPKPQGQLYTQEFRDYQFTPAYQRYLDLLAMQPAKSRSR